MVCNMCDPDGNPCDRCKIAESMPYYEDDPDPEEELSKVMHYKDDLTKEQEDLLLSRRDE